MKLNSKQSGMTMLEVVVAMLVIGLGMAVSINMLQVSVRYNEEAEFRSIALGKIDQITDLMRTNRLAANKGSYNYPKNPVDVNNAATWVAPKASNINCSKGCKPEEFALRSAQSDLFEWGRDLRQSLPQGAANIEFVRGGSHGVLSAQYRVTIFWRYVQESDKGKKSDKDKKDDVADFKSVSMLITL